MLIHRTLGAVFASAVWFAAASTGCDDNDDFIDCVEFDEFGGCVGGGDIDTAIDNAERLGENRGRALANQAAIELAFGQPGVLTGQLGAIMLACDNGIIAQAQVELDLGVEPGALNFADLIINAREIHIGEINTFLGRVGVDVINNPIADAVAADAAAGAASLATLAPPEIDFWYARFSVVLLSQCAELIDQLRDLTSNDLNDLNAFLDNTEDDLEDERDQASAIMRGYGDLFVFPDLFPGELPPGEIPPVEIPPGEIPPEEIPPEEVPPDHDHV